jgi:hypothetical protein
VVRDDGAAPVTRLARLWTGDLPLDEAFWGWAVAGGLLVNLATSLAFLTLMAADRPFVALVAGYGPSAPYNLVVLVGVWRAAARHTADPSRAQLMRIVTLVAMAVMTVT